MHLFVETDLTPEGGESRAPDRRYGAVPSGALIHVNARPRLNLDRCAAPPIYLHQQALDTSTPSGRALFGMLGVFSEFERAMIRDRVMAGLDRARSSGKRLGRPRTTPFSAAISRDKDTYKRGEFVPHN